MQLQFAQNSTAFIPSLYDFLASIETKCQARVDQSAHELTAKLDACNARVDNLTSLIQSEVQRILTVEIKKIVNAMVPGDGTEPSPLSLTQYLSVIEGDVGGLQASFADNLECQRQGKVAHVLPDDSIECRYASPRPICAPLDVSGMVGVSVACNGNDDLDTCVVSCAVRTD